MLIVVLEDQVIQALARTQQALQISWHGATQGCHGFEVIDSTHPVHGYINLMLIEEVLEAISIHDRTLSILIKSSFGTHFLLGLLKGRVVSLDMRSTSQ